MLEELQNLKNQAIAQITESNSLEEIEEVRISYLGRSGKLASLTKEIKNLKTEEKKRAGILINQTKNVLLETLARQRKQFEETPRKWFDATIPGKMPQIGSYHPTTIVITEMFKIFQHLGFSIREDREIETDTFNFERLNLPKDHPARSLQDALYIEEPEIVLRTHTSSVEARDLVNLKPPYRVVVAGKSYRYENVNASNNAMFYQFQGYAVQEGLSMADLKGTFYYFIRSFFGEEREIRYRCKYYPEVEPGVGLDLDCIFCNKRGCSVCKGRGWVEILGAGMIHPNMLKEAGINPKKQSGFAFGMGLDRIVMDRFQISDIRSLYNGDIRYDS